MVELWQCHCHEENDAGVRIYYLPQNDSNTGLICNEVYIVIWQLLWLFATHYPRLPHSKGGRHPD